MFVQVVLDTLSQLNLHELLSPNSAKVLGLKDCNTFWTFTQTITLRAKGNENLENYTTILKFEVSVILSKKWSKNVCCAANHYKPFNFCNCQTFELTCDTVNNVNSPGVIFGFPSSS